MGQSNNKEKRNQQRRREDRKQLKRVVSWMPNLKSISRRERSIVSNAADRPSKMRTET